MNTKDTTIGYVLGYNKGYGIGIKKGGSSGGIINGIPVFFPTLQAKLILLSTLKPVDTVDIRVTGGKFSDNGLLSHDVARDLLKSAVEAIGYTFINAGVGIDSKYPGSYTVLYKSGICNNGIVRSLWYSGDCRDGYCRGNLYCSQKYNNAEICHGGDTIVEKDENGYSYLDVTIYTEKPDGLYYGKFTKSRYGGINCDVNIAGITYLHCERYQSNWIWDTSGFNKFATLTNDATVIANYPSFICCSATINGVLTENTGNMCAKAPSVGLYKVYDNDGVASGYWLEMTGRVGVYYGY